MSRLGFRTVVLAAAANVLCFPTTVRGQDAAAAADEPVVLGRGAWCWFQDERVLVDTEHATGPLLLLTAITFGKKGSPTDGDLMAYWWNLETNERGQFELHDRFEADDHDNAALHVRADGRYLAVYSKHGSDKLVRWRISEKPHDPRSWRPEQTLRHRANVCYSNVFEIKNANGKTRLVNFARADGYDPNYFTSSDAGDTWKYGGKLHTGPRGNRATRQRPYVKYASRSPDALHFVTTDGHPRDEDNSIYHGVVRRGRIRASNGKKLGPLATKRTSPIRSPDLTTVLATGTEFDGVAMRHAWTVDLHVHGDGKPYTIITARADGDRTDHRFLFARWTGSRWAVHEIAKAGGFLYRAEDDYTGLAALDPTNNDRLVISTNVDPRDDSALEHYELFLGRAQASGASWDWAPLTWDSESDNLRPAIPIGRNGRTVVTWLRGHIRTYKSWSAEVVARQAQSLEQLIVPGQETVRRAATAAGR